jgi:TetR/AcrR family transcriptional regulator
VTELLAASRRRRRTKPTRDAEATKKRLLDAAEVAFAKKGFAGARLGAIASAARAQQALVHHYFGDKEGLYAAVLTRAVEATMNEGWDILQRIPAAPARGKKARSLDLPALRALVDAFVASLLRFFATHAALLSIVRYDARAGGEFTRELVTRTSKPMFDQIARMLTDLARRGVVRRDLDGRHFCVSVFAMCAYPYYDEEFLTLLWPVDVRGAEFMGARRREIVETAMARLAPAR